MNCESQGFKDVATQSQVLDPNGPNGRENSWGIAQFNLPTDLTTASGSPITKDTAVDPIQAVDAAAYNFSIGNADRWTCYRDKTGW